MGRAVSASSVLNRTCDKLVGGRVKLLIGPDMPIIAPWRVNCSSFPWLFAN